MYIVKEPTEKTKINHVELINIDDLSSISVDRRYLSKYKVVYWKEALFFKDTDELFIKIVDTNLIVWWKKKLYSVHGVSVIDYAFIDKNLNIKVVLRDIIRGRSAMVSFGDCGICGQSSVELTEYGECTREQVKRRLVLS